MKPTYGKGAADCFVVRSKPWDKRRRALKVLHKMYLEDIEEGSLDECCPMSFPQFVQSEYENIKEHNCHLSRSVKGVL